MVRGEIASRTGAPKYSGTKPRDAGRLHCRIPARLVRDEIAVRTKVSKSIVTLNPVRESLFAISRFRSHGAERIR